MSNAEIMKLVALMDSAGFRVLDIGREKPGEGVFQSAHVIIFTRQDTKPPRE